MDDQIRPSSKRLTVFELNLTEGFSEDFRFEDFVGEVSQRSAEEWETLANANRQFWFPQAGPASVLFVLMDSDDRNDFTLQVSFRNQRGVFITDVRFVNRRPFERVTTPAAKQEYMFIS